LFRVLLMFAVDCVPVPRKSCDMFFLRPLFEVELGLMRELEVELWRPWVLIYWLEPFAVKDLFD
jgi:hypothetical protein